MSGQPTKLGAASAATDGQIVSMISEIVTRITGVQLGEKQRHMVESRLKKRVLELGVENLAGFAQYFAENEQIETQALVSLLTTHHTYFFRESFHFDFFEKAGLAKLLPVVRARPDKTLRIWSAACSRGQEVYTLAMIMDRAFRDLEPELKYEIYGTDVDSDSVKIARNGVFHRKEIKEVPAPYLADHWARGTGEISEFVKAKNSLKKGVQFATLNLGEPAAIAKLPKFDAIFCRNVFIYFTPEKIKTITESILSRLSSDGFLFLGISETLYGLNLPVQSVGASIYAHPSATPVTPLKVVPAPAPEPLIRVLCVDDSPSILSLMKVIFTKTAGYDLVGTASDGMDAAEKVKSLKPDVITLDIHMPGQDGIAYLQANFGFRHPPVVMVSSVNRDNADLALKALELGASDYVEKPALNQLKDRTEEIRTKVRTALRSVSRTNVLTKGPTKVDLEFTAKMVIDRPEEKLRILFGQISDRKSIGLVLKEMKSDEPPCLILFEQAANTLAQFAQILSSECRRKVEIIENLSGSLRPGQIYIGDYAQIFGDLTSKYFGRTVSILVVGEPTPLVCQGIQSWTGSQILIEELGADRKHPLFRVASDQFPATSFMALSREYLSSAGKTRGAPKK